MKTPKRSRDAVADVAKSSVKSRRTAEKTPKAKSAIKKSATASKTIASKKADEDVVKVDAADAKKDRRKRLAGAALALGLAAEKKDQFIPLEDRMEGVAGDDESEDSGEEEEEKEDAAAIVMGQAGSDAQDADDEVDALLSASKKKGAKGAKGKKTSKLPALASDKGVIYLGHIPYGFFEEQMNGFFEQFGSIQRLRLSRSKKTGRSRGYAFIQFESAEVAEIVQKTMHNYILCDKLLVCEVVKPENVHARMFEGADRKAPRRPIDRARMDAKRLNKDRTIAQKTKRNARATLRQGKQLKAIKAKGINYEFNGLYKAAATKAQ